MRYFTPTTPFVCFTRLICVTLVGLLLNSPVLQAQSDSIEWKAHIVVEQKWRGLSDTIVIGCAYQGGTGYQDSLDSINTDFTAPLSIRGSDLQIAADSGTCPSNMRQDIRAFDTTVVFRFYVKSDTFPGEWWESMSPDSVNLLKWDTGGSVHYEDQKYILDYVTIYSYGGYMDEGFMGGVDKDFWQIKSKDDVDKEGRVRLILEKPGVWFTDSACDDLNYVMGFDVECKFTDLTDTVNVPKVVDNTLEVKIRQIPHKQALHLTFAAPFSGKARVYNMQGQAVETIHLPHVTSGELDYSSYPKGMYILHLQDSTSQRVMTRKFTVF